MANPRTNDLTFSGTSQGIGTTGGGSQYGSHSPFGTVPGPISVAPNTFSQVNQNVPGFGNLTQGTSNVINSELSGNVSPATLAALKNASATFGITSGMGPGSGLGNNALFANIAGFSENQQRLGAQNYMNFLPTVAGTMTNPALATEVADRNATLAAAPDPALAYQQQMKDWMTKFNLTRGPAGGTLPNYGGRPPDASTVHLPPTYGRTDALGMPQTDATWTEPSQTPVYGALGPFSDYQPNLNWQSSPGDTMGGGNPIYGPPSPNQYSSNDVMSWLAGGQGGEEV